MFTFDRNYDNLEQVAEYLPAFLSVLAELEAAGQYRYNDSFRGRIPGIEGPCEDTAIYLLQGLERQHAQDAKVAALLDAGYVHVDALSAATKYEHVVLYPTRRMGGEWAEYRDARVVPVANPHAQGQPFAVLPKGKRTNGHLISGRRVLAKVAS